MALDARTIIKNTSGQTRHFSFIPPHGVTLVADEEYSIIGDLWSLVKNNRSRTSLETALTSGALSLVQTPGAAVLDSVTGETKVVGATNGSVVLNDPSYEEEESD